MADSGAGVAERTNLLSPRGLKSPNAAGSRPVVPSGTLGFKMGGRESPLRKIPTPAPETLQKVHIAVFHLAISVVRDDKPQ